MSTATQPTANIPPDDPQRTLAVSQPDNPPHIGVVGDTYTILLTGKDTAGRYCLIDMHIPPGGGPPPHRHDFEESFIVLEGELQVIFRGAKSTLHAGGAAFFGVAYPCGLLLARVGHSSLQFLILLCRNFNLPV